MGIEVGCAALKNMVMENLGTLLGNKPSRLEGALKGTHVFNNYEILKESLKESEAKLKSEQSLGHENASLEKAIIHTKFQLLKYLQEEDTMPEECAKLKFDLELKSNKEPKFQTSPGISESYTGVCILWAREKVAIREEYKLEVHQVAAIRLYTENRCP